MSDQEIRDEAAGFVRSKELEHVRPNRLKVIRARLIEKGGSLVNQFDNAIEKKQAMEPWRHYGDGVEIAQRIALHSAPLGHELVTTIGSGTS